MWSEESRPHQGQLSSRRSQSIDSQVMAASDINNGLLLVNVDTQSLARARNAVWNVSAVLVSNGRGRALGADEQARAAMGAGVRVIDCQRMPLLPAFVDSHCHVMAYASSLTAVDCRPSGVSSIAGIKDAIRSRAASTPEGRWVRAAGYDDFALAEKRHPTRWDLDEAAPRNPVRLTHRSGHAMVLNSPALNAVGISDATDEPPGGTIDRGPLSGEPSGLLLEMDEYVRDRMPRLTEEELRSAMRLAGDKFLSYGITAVCDASPANTPQRFETFKKMRQSGHFLPRVTMMAGAKYLDQFVDEGLGIGAGNELCSVGHAKITLTLSSGRLSPSENELSELISKAHSQQFPVAIHAVEAEALKAAVNALESATPLTTRTRTDRIEHCSECPDALLPRIARLGVTVVTNPGFLYLSGDRYLAETKKDRVPWLYRMRSLIEAGIPVAAGSDAPVTDPNPMTGIYSAVTRRSQGGNEVNTEERLGLEQALTMHSRPVDGKGRENLRARQVDDKFIPADLVLLDRPLNENEPEEILKTKVAMTIRGGEVVYEA